MTTKSTFSQWTTSRQCAQQAITHALRDAGHQGRLGDVDRPVVRRACRTGLPAAVAAVDEGVVAQVTRTGVDLALRAHGRQGLRSGRVRLVVPAG